MIEPQARDAFAAWQEGRLAEFLQLAAIDEGLQNILLHVQVGVEDRGLLLSELRETVDRFGHRVVPDIVRGRFRTEQEVIAYVLLDEAVAVVAADDGVGQVEILDHGLELPAVPPGDLAAEDHRELAGLADGSIGVQQALAQSIEGHAPMKDQVVAVLDLGEEQAMPTAGVGALPRRKEGGEAGQPLLSAAGQVSHRQRVGEVLEAFGDTASHQGIGALLKVDTLRPEPIGQPVMLVQIDPRREGKVRAEPDEHPAPVAIVDVEVVLDDPPLGQLQVPPVILLVADRDHDPSRLASLQDDDDLVRLGVLEIRLYELVAPPGGRVQEWGAPSVRAVLDPAVELVGDVAERVPAHELVIAVGVEEPDDALGLLEGLDHAVEQNPIEAPVSESNAIVVVLVERVHGVLPRGEIPGAYGMNASTGTRGPSGAVFAKDVVMAGQGPAGRSPARARASDLHLRLTPGVAGISRAEPLASRLRGGCSSIHGAPNN